MDLHRRVGVHGLIAPNSFAVTLAKPDVERFANFLDALVRELAEAAREHARNEQYTFVGPIDVQILEGSRLRPGRFSVAAEVIEGPDGLIPAELVLPGGGRHQIGADPVVVGRLPDCDIVLNDPNVSRRHVEVVRVNETFVVRDLGSTNGTKLNGVPVRESYLTTGDNITVGSTTLVFEML
jgi:hypothetical protein